jgi:hypothetical protein
LGVKKDRLLVSKLQKLVEELPIIDGKKPCIEVRTGEAVLIRKLTNLPDDILNDFIEKADSIHQEVTLLI